MRIDNATRKMMKSEFRRFIAYYPQTTKSHIAKTFSVSRVTAGKWLDEIRDEQIKQIDADTRRVELWRLEEKGKMYEKMLTYLHGDLNHLWNKFPHVLLGVIKAQWQIDKEIYQLKLDLYSRELNEEEMKKINSIDQRIGIATVVNVQNTQQTERR